MTLKRVLAPLLLRCDAPSSEDVEIEDMDPDDDDVNDDEMPRVWAPSPLTAQGPPHDRESTAALETGRVVAHEHRRLIERPPIG